MSVASKQVCSSVIRPRRSATEAGVAILNHELLHQFDSADFPPVESSVPVIVAEYCGDDVLSQAMHLVSPTSLTSLVYHFHGGSFAPFASWLSSQYYDTHATNYRVICRFVY